MKKETSLTEIKQKSQEDEEKLLILSKADTFKGEQLVITQTGLKTENEIKLFALGSVENPEKKYDIYYKGIMRLLRKYLPKGQSNKKARSFIYEEKNTLLTRGKRINNNGIRGGDSRMGYSTDIEEFLEIITNWIVGKGTMVELYNTLRNLNISKGYGSPKY